MSQKDQAESDGIDFAWRVHDALDSWTGKVDTKASIALAVEVAIAGITISASSSHGSFAHLSGFDLLLYRLGSPLLGVSMFFAIAVVMPQLGRRAAKKNWSSNFIYFGHLRRWDPHELATKLEENKHNSLEQLALQLVTMSRVSWRKHAWLQWSLIALVLGSAALLIAAT